MALELASSRRETCVGDKHDEESLGLRTLQVVAYRPPLEEPMQEGIVHIKLTNRPVVLDCQFDDRMNSSDA